MSAVESLGFTRGRVVNAFLKEYHINRVDFASLRREVAQKFGGLTTVEVAIPEWEGDEHVTIYGRAHIETVADGQSISAIMDGIYFPPGNKPTIVDRFGTRVRIMPLDPRG